MSARVHACEYVYSQFSFISFGFGFGSFRFDFGSSAWYRFMIELEM